MFTSRNRVLALLALGLLAAPLFLEGDQLELQPEGPVFPRLSSEAAARVVVLRPASDEEPAERVELVRGESGWVVLQRADFPAEGWLVEELLARLAALRTTEEVAREERSHAALGVGPGALELRVLDGRGAPLAVLQMGVAPSPHGGASLPHVRPGGSSSVFRAPQLPLVEALPDAWLRPRLFELEVDQVVALVLRGRLLSGVPFEERIELDPGGDWRGSDGERLARARVRRLLTDLLGLQLSSIRSEADAPALQIGQWLGFELHLRDGPAVALELGPPMEGGLRLGARRAWLDAGRPWRAPLPASVLEALIAWAHALAGVAPDD